MEKYFEDLYRDLGLNDAERENWYKARYYVLNIMEPLDGNGISPTSSEHIHVVIENADNPLMQAVTRQICLIAHYPNFNDESGENRTRITMCSKNPALTYMDMRDQKVLGNLLEYCKSTGKENECLLKNCKCTEKYGFCKSTCNLIPLDIEFEFLEKNTYSEKDVRCVTLYDVERTTKNLDVANAKIDVTMGMLVNMVYNTGVEIQNLPATDNANIDRYSTALNVFCYKLKSDMICQKWSECAKLNNKGKFEEIDIKNKLSSVFCADCFGPRIKGLLDTKEKSLAEYLLHDFDTVMQNICKAENLNALARCEHSRWNVEKLILDFEPLLEKDWYELENCFGKERDDKIKYLKKKKYKHIDLCSYKNLRRVNPADIKYDYFLMLAMPQIMRSYLLAE